MLFEDDPKILERMYTSEELGVLLNILRQVSNMGEGDNTTGLNIQIFLDIPMQEGFPDSILMGEHTLYTKENRTRLSLNKKRDSIDLWEEYRHKGYRRSDLLKSYKDPFIELLTENFDNIPLYINKTDNVTKAVVKWRLTIGR